MILGKIIGLKLPTSNLRDQNNSQAKLAGVNYIFTIKKKKKNPEYEYVTCSLNLALHVGSDYRCLFFMLALNV